MGLMIVSEYSVDMYVSMSSQRCRLFKSCCFVDWKVMIVVVRGKATATAR